MEHLYFVSDDLNAMEHARNELISLGFRPHQVHVLGPDDAPLRRHHLNPLHRMQKTDLVRGSLLGAGAGLAIATVILLAAFLSGAGHSTSWLLFLFVAVSTVGMLAIEGALFGCKRLNCRLRCFERQLQRGFHIMIVDFTAPQRAHVQAMYQHYPQLAMAASTPH